MKPRIGILTFSRDAHAWAVKERLEQNGRAHVHVIGVDRLAESTRLRWSASRHDGSTLPTACGAGVAVGRLSVLWDRRTGRVPQVGVDDEALQDLIDEECDVALDGILASDFTGRWVSEPSATRAARNPLRQLRIAAAAGFRVPTTIVTQDPDEVRAFAAAHPILVRTLRGAPAVPAELDDDAIRLAPAIYQAAVPSRRRLRVTCFGERQIAVLVDGRDEGWRTSLATPIGPHRLDPATREKLGLVLRALGLRMAVVDLALDDAGEPIWSELQPQGSFLRLGDGLVDACCDFLLGEAAHRDARHPASPA